MPILPKTGQAPASGSSCLIRLLIADVLGQNTKTDAFIQAACMVHIGEDTNVFQSPRLQRVKRMNQQRPAQAVTAPLFARAQFADLPDTPFCDFAQGHPRNLSAMPGDLP